MISSCAKVNNAVVNISVLKPLLTLCIISRGWVPGHGAAECRIAGSSGPVSPSLSHTLAEQPHSRRPASAHPLLAEFLKVICFLLIVEQFMFTVENLENENIFKNVNYSRVATNPKCHLNICGDGAALFCPCSFLAAPSVPGLGSGCPCPALWLTVAAGWGWWKQPCNERPIPWAAARVPGESASGDVGVCSGRFGVGGALQAHQPVCVLVLQPRRPLRRPRTMELPAPTPLSPGPRPWPQASPAAPGKPPSPSWAPARPW